MPEVLREALRIREGIRDGDGTEYLHDRAARGHDTTAFTAYVVREGVASGT